MGSSKANRIYANVMLTALIINVSALMIWAGLTFSGVVSPVSGVLGIIALFAWCCYGYQLQKRIVLSIMRRRQLFVREIA